MKDVQSSESYDIFISHSHEDYEKVNLYLKYLIDKHDGLGEIFPVFIAHKDITPTKKWEDEIVRALKSTKIFIAYITPNFKKSNWCDQECGFAYATNKLIIPLIDGHDPYGFIGKYQGKRIPSNIRDSRLETLQKKELKEFAVSIIKLIYDNPQYRDMVRNEIFENVEKISSYSQTDLVFSFLRYLEPFTEEEKNTILKAYEENSQIKDAHTADSLVNELKQNR